MRLLIKGKVQGVFYRATAKDMADSIGITGWVKNTSDGDVEIMATGGTKQIDEFIAWCRKGPKKAMVTDVIITTEKEELFNGFLVRRS